MKRLVKPLQMVRRGFGVLRSFGLICWSGSGQAGVCPDRRRFRVPGWPGQGARSAMLVARQHFVLKQ